MAQKRFAVINALSRQAGMLLLCNFEFEFKSRRAEHGGEHATVHNIPHCDTLTGIGKLMALPSASKSAGSHSDCCASFLNTGLVCKRRTFAALP